MSDPVLMYVPYPLVVQGRPEVSAMPRNIVFASFCRLNGETAVARALYVPDLDTLEVSDERVAMTYRNERGGEYHVEIVHDRREKRWLGRKLGARGFVGCATGGVWDRFFQQLTLIGLRGGEPCEFWAVLKGEEA